jgi:hypothetical protein
MTIFTAFALLTATVQSQSDCSVYFSNNSEELTIQLEGQYYGVPDLDPVSGDSIMEEAVFEWTMGDITQTGGFFNYTVEEAGTYEICVTATGLESECTATYCNTIFIGMDPLTLDMESGFEVEGDLTSGWASAMASGGEAPYSFLWSNEATTQTITGLSTGTYCVTVTDADENTINSCVTLWEDTTDYPSGLFIIDFDYEYYEVGDEYLANVTTFINGDEAPFTYAWEQETELSDPLSIIHEYIEPNTDMIEGVIPGYPVYLEVTDALGETAFGSFTVPEYGTEEEPVDDITEIVDTCLVEGELVHALIDDYWIEDDLLYVTWVFYFVEDEPETLTLAYEDVAELIEGIYDITLYIDCPDGFKSISSFYDQIEIDPIMLNINENAHPIKTTLYPNPVKEVLNIIIETNYDEATILITDISGRIIESRIENNVNTPIRINTSKLPSGMYFVTIQAKGHTESLKFMK